MTINDRGKAFIALGRAMLDETSTMEELAALALDCGLSLTFRLHPNDPQPDSAGAPHAD